MSNASVARRTTIFNSSLDSQCRDISLSVSLSSISPGRAFKFRWRDVRGAKNERKKSGSGGGGSVLFPLSDETKGRTGRDKQQGTCSRSSGDDLQRSRPVPDRLSVSRASSMNVPRSIERGRHGETTPRVFCCARRVCVRALYSAG